MYLLHPEQWNLHLSPKLPLSTWQDFKGFLDFHPDAHKEPTHWIWSTHRTSCSAENKPLQIQEPVCNIMNLKSVLLRFNTWSGTRQAFIWVWIWTTVFHKGSQHQTSSVLSKLLHFRPANVMVTVRCVGVELTSWFFVYHYDQMWSRKQRLQQNNTKTGLSQTTGEDGENSKLQLLLLLELPTLYFFKSKLVLVFEFVLKPNVLKF